MIMHESMVSGIELVPPHRPLTTSLRQLLREQTADVHAKLERSTALNQKISTKPANLKSMTKSGSELPSRVVANQEYQELYKSFLQITRALELGFEAQIDERPLARKILLSIGLELESPKASELIVADLEKLGVDTKTSMVQIAPLPQPSTLHELLGMQYVRLGSRLGGTMIAKIAELHLGSEVPREFLIRHGAGVKLYVEDCFGSFERAGRSSIFDHEAIVVAQQTFKAIMRWQIETERSFKELRPERPSTTSRVWNWLTR